ncbi:MAG: hypothetical protein RLZZ511_2402 [Cyanobacteriota bacterium]|jgi:hypothetical protein
MEPHVLTIAEIRQRYDGEWVLVAYKDLDDQLQVLSGEVLAHSPDRDVVYAALPLGRDRDVAIECFAHIPEDLAFIL